MARCRWYRDEAARAFRLGMEGQASENLIEFIDRYSHQLGSRTISPGEMEGIAAVLGELFEAQARKDYLYLADLLEYRLVV